MMYSTRPMCLDDITQVTEIERASFPAPWPASNFERELLHNKLAQYLVAWGKGERTKMPASDHLILGYAGLWYMVDEAHLISIAVRETYRRQGIGELLLISAINVAVERDAQFITLEVRISNSAAQALYEKYGFAEAGARLGYYPDNREDALIMTTDRIISASFQSNFQRLKQVHAERWAVSRACRHGASL